MTPRLLLPGDLVTAPGEETKTTRWAKRSRFLIVEQVSREEPELLGLAGA